MTRLRTAAAALLAAGLLTGCGEITNTLTPPPGTATPFTVALAGPPNFTQAGIYEARVRGDFAQTDLHVRLLMVADPLKAIEDGRAEIAVASEPAVLLTRNRHIAVAAVAALLQGPEQLSVRCGAAAHPAANRTRTGPRRTGTHTATATVTTTALTTAPRAHPPLRPLRCRAVSDAHPDPAYRQAPTYNRLNLVVTENEIVNHAPVLRRFVQALARGYEAVRADPAAAAAALVDADPTLNVTAQLTGIRASLADFFPTAATTTRPWGFQTVADWNAFGSWMLDHHLISNINATPDAVTNELLAGQGV
ncbi:ABC transporter substrate-binding protein [Conexibacter sp. DBS9H8]|uniref:ABC transporter substrate-binding protein n=1 Tax=Conexibacter sp. DBS9H8 TaxID=2937801 RepID=UPI0020107AFA|nr:ABC transporter substrate-binding protein [Conexibacter sp. DBS9H8]